MVYFVRSWSVIIPHIFKLTTKDEMSTEPSSFQPRVDSPIPIKPYVPPIVKRCAPKQPDMRDFKVQRQESGIPIPQAGKRKFDSDEESQGFKREKVSSEEEQLDEMGRSFVYTFTGKPGAEKGQILEWTPKNLRFGEPFFMNGGSRFKIEYLNTKTSEFNVFYLQTPKMYTNFGAQRYKGLQTSRLSFPLSFYGRKMEDNKAQNSEVLQEFYTQIKHFEEAVIDFIISRKEIIFPDRRQLPNEMIRYLFKSSIRSKVQISEKNGMKIERVFESLNVAIPKQKGDFRIWKGDTTVNPDEIVPQSWLRCVIYPILYVKDGAAGVSWTLCQGDIEPGFRVDAQVARTKCMVDEY